MKRLLQLHERTRRQVGLSAFVLLGLLPTMGILMWGVSRCMPSQETDMEERLSELFGLKVTVEAVEYPEPGLVRLRGVVFHRPELKVDTETDARETSTSALPVARLETLEIRRGQRADPYGKLRDTICLAAVNLELNLDEIAEVTRLFQEVVDYRLNDSRANVQLVLDRVRFFDATENARNDSSESGPLEHELSTIRFRLLALEYGPEARLSFSLVDTQRDKVSQPILFRVGQVPAGDPTDRKNASLWFDLDTQTEPIPCRLLGKCLSLFDSFGPDARFSGYFSAWSTPDGWSGRVVRPKTDQNPIVPAMLSNVDLDTMVGRRFSQVLTGKVNITIGDDGATFVAGRIERLHGRIESIGPGTIGQPLLTAAANEMGINIKFPSSGQDVIPFEELKAEFMLDQHGISIKGGYPGDVGKRPILLGVNTGRNREWIAWESGRWVDVTSLLKTLAPGVNSHIPAVRSVEWLAGRLPAK